MADQNTHINYSVADIERYLNGGMSTKEMHDMERAALQDPFLADAIEGFSEVPFEQSHRHLNEITALLHGEKKDAKVVAMPAKKIQWLRVAAMIVLIAGAGTISWYILSLNDSATEKNIAQVTVAEKQNTDTVLQPVLNDTTKLIAQNFTVQKKSSEAYKAKDNTTVAPSLKKNELAALSSVTDDAGKNAAPVTIKDAENKAQIIPAPEPAFTIAQKPPAYKLDSISPGISSLYANNNLVNEFKGRVTDNYNQPVANAVVSTPDQRATYTDAAGNFIFKSPDSLLNVTVASLGYFSAQTKLKRNAENNIAIVPDSKTLSEVVVSGYSTKNKMLRKDNSSDSATPAGGWESFQKYVYNQLGKEQDTTLTVQPYNNGVEVEFVINDDGVPYNFKVKGSYSDELTSKAIDIIKHGPKWIAARKNKKAKVTIPF